MLYAKFMHPDSGRECNIEHAKKVGLKVGERYEVKDIIMGGFTTSIFLKDIEGSFNSVQFEFEEDGEFIDIFDSPKYNPYLSLF